MRTSLVRGTAVSAVFLIAGYKSESLYTVALALFLMACAIVGLSIGWRLAHGRDGLRGLFRTLTRPPT